MDRTPRSKPGALPPVTVFIDVAARPVAQEFTVRL
jgi:hypothetical protein